MGFPEVLELLVVLRDHNPANEDARFLVHCLNNISGSRAQMLQDLWVTFERPGRRNGFFVEFGAGDGVRYSNTAYLERELGWTGIVAEPARIYRTQLRANRRCFVDNRCVWTKTGETLLFNQAAIPAHSTLDAFSDSDNLGPTRETGARYEVETVSLNDLLAHWNAPRRIDYLSADTEGSELAILQALDFERYDVGLISVEHNHTDKRREIFDLLTSKGYRRTLEAMSGVDDWYVKTGWSASG
ncbi:MAG TPA: FkbM family methyltransferase [Phenylobacterium sp.]|jgi:FkbM family methyltransferase|uniref:FkbM family methyltransferase n=1 Tax=Phenylobacterium sp. TaxID=1871053 RepID=UPI002CDF1630|nr:FkbM family methyltransferase [Phenylobacterium sp.]HXA37473.1 FkbM family methyltransferase [Phenylobacterium sp.]